MFGMFTSVITRSGGFVAVAGEPGREQLSDLLFVVDEKDALPGH